MDADTAAEALNFSCELGVLSQCDGSALLNNGQCAVLSGVYGPVSVRLQKELMDRACVEVNYRSLTGSQGVELRVVEELVCNTFREAILTKLHPRTLISISLQQLEEQPQLLLSSCINAASLALLDAAVPMKFVPVAVTCTVDRAGNMLIDPSAVMQDISASVTLVYDAGSGDIVTVEHCQGQLTPEQLSSCVKTALPPALQLLKLCRAAVASKFSRDFVESKPSAHLVQSDVASSVHRLVVPKLEPTDV